MGTLHSLVRRKSSKSHTTTVLFNLVPLYVVSDYVSISRLSPTPMNNDVPPTSATPVPSVSLPEAQPPQDPVALTSFMASTVETMRQMGTAMQLLLANYAVLSSAPQPTTTPSTTPQPQPERKLPPGVKPPTPSRFDGADRRKTPTWLEQTKQTLLLAGWTLTDPTSIAYTASFLTGKAHQWWDTEMRTCPDDHPHKASAGFATWTDFATAALDALGEDRRQDRARERLLKLTQSSSVLSYGERFTALMNLLPNMHADDARFFYLRGLKPGILSIITGKFQVTSTWQEIHALAMSADSIRLPLSTSNRFNSLSRPEPLDPMDIGNINTSSHPSASSSRTSSPAPHYTRDRPATPARPRKLTDAERERLKAKGACFRCREVGHMADDPKCPMNALPKNRYQRSPGRSSTRGTSPSSKN